MRQKQCGHGQSVDTAEPLGSSDIPPVVQAEFSQSTTLKVGEKCVGYLKGATLVLLR